jgi:pimeloyl-ACP methyl ester carboxylesterase
MLAGRHPPPGQLVDVGDRLMHLNCTGEGSPTVVLEAGNADFSVHWAKVQPELARLTRVCSYDRAGLGWSEPGSEPRTSLAMVRDLAGLLDAEGVDGPLVLVGHSFGAINVRLFSAAHPERVAGVVLVDPAHGDQLEAIPALRDATTQGVAQFEGLVALADLGILAMMPGAIPNRGLPDAAQEQYVAVLATSGFFRAAAAETAALAENLAAANAGEGSLGDTPLVVISRGQPAAPADLPAADVAAFEGSWRDLQADMLGLSSRSRQVIATQSGHDVHLDQPELVVDAVASLVGVEGDV